MRRIVVALLLSLITTVSLADTQIGSWNIQRLGNGEQKSYQALAKVAGEFDFLSVQEVMNESALVKLDKALEDATGQKWEHMNTLPLGRNSYKEMYAFFWKPNRIDYVDGAVTYLDRGNKFEREPFSARFKSKESGQQFVAATVHILYGNSEDDRTPEIRKLAEYWEWLHTVYPDTREILLMGDFNMNPNHPAWNPLKEVARPLITEGASTLSAKNGKFSNLYDNIWVSKTAPLNVKTYGIVDYPKIINWSHEKSRKHVSDHAPVYVTLGSKASQSGNAGAVQSQKHQTAASQPKASQMIASANNEIKGNSKSRIYHLPSCGSYQKLSSQNTVTFATEADAQSAGYRKAGNCN